MQFTSVSDNRTSENTYMIYDEATSNGVIVDPGCDIEKILKMIEDKNIHIKYILLTHCHYDHIKSLNELKEKTGAEIVSGDNCSRNVKRININLSVYGLGYEINDVNIDRVIFDNEKLILDSLEIKCIYTPGHTDCSVCYIIDNEIFSGDTLFLRTCGRWDLPTGEFNTLEKSIKEKLYSLPDDMNVYPGHGEKTTIGYEKKYNFCIKL